MKRWVTGLIAAMVLIFTAACSQTDTETGTDAEGMNKVKVTTTIAQIADIVRNVGGEHVDVESLMGPGTDPHLYQATQQDIGKLNDADIIFYNGLHLEGKMNEIFEKMRSEKPTHAVADGVDKSKLIEEGIETYDPHIWFDISLWQFAVDEVVAGLSELDQENAESYKENGESYKQELAELDAFAKGRIQEIPEQSRMLVTAHDAFNYFGNAYGMEVKGLQGLSTDSEYGLKDVQNIIDVLVEREIKAVFIESSISEESIRAVVEGAGKRGHEVTIGGELYSDAMGEEGTEEGTYIGMFKHNINTITDSLK